MELSYFNKMRTIHNTLSTPGYTFTEMDLKGRISFSESVNAGEELTIGSCVMSTIEFSLFDLNYLVDDITGKEFTWTKSVQTGQNHYKKLAKASRAGVVCINGEVSYVFNSRPPYVSIWDVETVSKISEPTAQPAQAVEGAAVVGNTLYCFHHESPYLTTYNISGQNLSQASAPALNHFHQEKIREYCKMGYSCNLQGDILKEYHVELYDQKPVNLIETVFERVQMGLFKAEKPVKSNDTLIKVSCTDRLNLFDRYVDSWLNQINYPTTIANLLWGLCAFVGVQAESYTFLNSDFQVKRNFIGQNVNGLQVLRWIAEAAANFGKITPAGKLKLGWYEPLDYTLDESVYRSITNEEYMVKKIDKLQVRVVENDIGVIVPADDPSRTNAYIIENNPLLYAETDAELRPTAQIIFNAIKDITYRPYSVTLPQNPLIHAGNIITISTRKGLTFPAYVMNRDNKAGMDSFSAVGDAERRIQSDSVNQSIQQIRGSVHTMTQTIEQLNSTITEYRQETQDAIDQTNENLSNFTDQVAGDLSGLQAQIDGQIESWFYDYEPTLNNPPASEWKTTQDKDKHLGDLFYNSKTGIGYRFSKAGNTYKWEILKDTDIGKALADAQKAQDTADGKRRVFVATPKPPYDVGDLWVNATYTGKYSNDLLRCKTARASGSLNINDWEKASKYTDDTTANEAIAKITVVQSEINQLANEISLKVSQTQYDKDNQLINEKVSKLVVDVNGITSTVQDHTGKISSFEQTINGFKLAIDNHKLIFDEDGLTVINGGFRIQNNRGANVFEVSESGSLTMNGSLITELSNLKTEVTGGKISFYHNNRLSGSISGANLSSGGALNITGTVIILNAGTVNADLVDADIGKFHSISANLADFSTASLSVSSLRATSTVSASTGSFNSITLGFTSLSMQSKTVVTDVTYNSILNTISKTTTTLRYAGTF